MGWTGQYLREGETVRSIIVDAYEGSALRCGACSWDESAHPRVTGSEYDAIYGPRSADNPRPAAHEFVAFVPSYRVLDYAQVALSEVYLAVETIATGEVWAGVTLVHRSRSGEVTYKDMSESMGPYYFRCPARILDRLTPTTHEAAIEWRAKCRARLAERASRPKVTAGSRVRFAEPIKFSNGTEHDLFEFVKGSTFRAVMPWGTSTTRYGLGDWRERAYSLA